MKRVRKPFSLWGAIKNFFLRIWWKILGEAKAKQLAENSSERTAAELAVARVVLETDITPDCVSAQIIRGGESIMVKHNDAWEVFIGKSYDHAAEKAVEWIKLQGDEISTNKVTKMNRTARRAFDAKRRAFRRH